MSFLPDHSLRRSFVIAHRGGNCLDRLRELERSGVDVVEADLRFFRGRVEVRHLNTVGPIPFMWDTWKIANPFAARIRLEQFLEHVDPKTRIMLDLKGFDPRLSRHVLAQLEGRPLENVTVCARNWRLLRPFVEHGGFKVVHSIGNRWQLQALVGKAQERRLHGVSVRASLLNSSSAKMLAERAQFVMAWPVNSVEQARNLISWGIHGLITDMPEAMASLMAELPDAVTGIVLPPGRALPDPPAAS